MLNYSVNHKKLVGRGLFFLLTILFLSSCVTHKEILIVDPINQEADSLIAYQSVEEVKIKKNDLLSILVSPKYAQDVETVAPYNIEKEGPTIYRVDNEGNITMPSIGKVHLLDMTTTTARNEIEQVLSPFLNDPVVIIELANFNVTMLGEFVSPGNIAVQGEELNILEAIGLANDLSDFADRTNIMVVRESETGKEFGYINLQSRKMFRSPFFKLQQGDVVYAIPVKQRTIRIPNETNRWLPFVTFGVTILNLVLVLTAI